MEQMHERSTSVVAHGGVLVGVDIGGTKTHCAGALPGGGRLEDWVAPSSGWADALVVDPASWIAGRVAEYLGRCGVAWADVAAVGVGAHRLEEQPVIREIQDQLTREAAGPAWRVVNDAQLVVPASGLAQGIGVICGTGSIVVGTDAAGNALRAGGWGWVLGDEGSGSALVREALKAVLRRYDTGRAPSELGRMLLEAAGLGSPMELAADLSFGRGPSSWAGFAPVVFAAADAGARDALDVIVQAGCDLADQIATLVGRGAVGRDVVVSGSVIVRQRRLYHALAEALLERCPGLSVGVLQEPPVTGALALAAGAV